MSIQGHMTSSSKMTCIIWFMWKRFMYKYHFRSTEGLSISNEFILAHRTQDIPWYFPKEFSSKTWLLLNRIYLQRWSRLFDFRSRLDRVTNLNGWTPHFWNGKFCNSNVEFLLVANGDQWNLLEYIDVVDGPALMNVRPDWY